MRIIRTREHTVNLGNYENVKIGATIELNDEDIPETVVGPEAFAEFADGWLDTLLKPELDEALANVPGKQDSHLEHWKK